jgi:hypothetical protein
MPVTPNNQGADPGAPGAQMPTPSPALAPTAQTVTISAEQFESFRNLQTKVAELEAANLRREQEAKDKEINLLKEKGDAENAVKTLRDQKDMELREERSKFTQIEERAKRYALDGELSRALAAQPLVSPAAAAQLANIFRSEFGVQPEGDGFAVRTRMLQSVGDFVKEKLAHADYSHFVKAEQRGGTAGGGSSAALTAPTAPANGPAAPDLSKLTFSDAIILDMQAKLTQRQAQPAALDRAQAFGLRPLAPARQA